jgi:protein TonB
MKVQIFGILLCTLISLPCAHAQEIKKLSQQQMDSIAQASDEIYDLVEVMPQFPGGQDSLRSYLKINTRMPQADIMGKVYLSFVVEKDGSISSVQVMRGLSDECDQEAIRVIQSMPEWIPGTQRKIPVRTRIRYAVSFNIINH